MITGEPEDSAVLSCNALGAHRIESIDAGFVPDNLDAGLIDTVISIANETAVQTAIRRILICTRKSLTTSFCATRVILFSTRSAKKGS